MDEEFEFPKIEQADISKSEFYQELARDWYTTSQGAMALLRLETSFQMTWILSEIRKYIGYHAEILDVGSGAGFFSNSAVQAGYEVTGLDISRTSLRVAELMDRSGRVKYVEGDAYKMPFAKDSFDVVVALDLFEHVSDPERIISEMSRVLRPGGLLFYRTINRNPASYIWINKVVKWIAHSQNTLLFDYKLFRKPEDIQAWCEAYDLEMQRVRGMRPALLQKGIWRLLRTRQINSDFRFVWCKNRIISYTGYAKKFRDH
ncbi:bifunctional 2-polyprenyl-6-hydroxyphenol methylase/3-demethylubiquinol 3-O-methyltransferase UbiG [Bdellovibrio sp. HCB274]|uniref:bifunctional 2-polyprenyl-6-hydroxyphenol methylase/3-demethylubiquinol 3-O-methyltransferase UbiG n=1 Tax=Bdellovibrio sp. HCB274 TaxID=3394361 RepID=UPI0039B49C27